MAKNQTRKTARGRGSNRTAILLAVCALLVVVVAALPTVVVICVGMIPTVVAYIIDLTPGRYAARCVAGLNAAGVVPFLDQLWGSTNDMTAAVAVVSDVFAWLTFYAASGVGWLLFLGLPSIVASFKTFSARRKVNALRERQQFLVKEWGAEITGTGGEDRNAAFAEETDAESDGRVSAGPAAA